MKNYWKQLLLALMVAMTAGIEPTVAISPIATGSLIQDQDDDQDDDRPLGVRVQEAIQKLESDPDEAIDLLKKVYKDYPENERVGLTLVQLTQQVGSQKSQVKREDGNPYYYDSAKIARQVMKDEDFPEQGRSLIATAIYNEACSLGVDGKKEEAMAVLEEAFDIGFDKYDLAISDVDFGDLLETDEFKKLVADARGGASERGLKALAREMEKFETFDFELETEDLDGDAISLSDMKGKIVVVNFWATWVPASAAEVPALIKLKKEFGDKLEVVGLAYERGDDDEAYDQVVAFMEKNNVNYPCTLGDEETQELLPEFTAFPTTVFIGKDGKVGFVSAGRTSFSRFELIVKKLLEADE